MTTTHDNAHDVQTVEEIVPALPPFTLHAGAPAAVTETVAVPQASDMDWIKRFTPDHDRVPGAELRGERKDYTRAYWIGGGVLAAVAIVVGIATDSGGPEAQKFVKVTNAGTSTIKLKTGVDPVLITVDATDGVVKTQSIKCAPALGQAFTDCAAPAAYAKMAGEWKVGTQITAAMCHTVAEIDLSKCQRQTGTY